MKNTFLYFGFMLLISGCSNLKSTMKPTYNSGGYTFNSYKSKSLLEADSALITGNITALNGDDTLMISTIKLGCIVQQTNSGVYQLKVKPFNVKSHLTTISLGYLTIETEPFATHPGDSIVVNFFLVQDERPLINCEGYQ